MNKPDGLSLERQIARMQEEFESCKILHGEKSEWAIEAGSILASLIELKDSRTELEQIHAVCLNIAECPPIAESDTATVRYVKDMALTIKNHEHYINAMQRNSQDTNTADTVAVPEGCTPEDARVLRRANHELAETEQRLRTALRFYANRYHFDVSGDPDAWDNVSGEPANFFCDEAGTATMEDGTIAKMALLGKPIDWKNEDGEDEMPPEIEGEYPEIGAMLRAAQEAK